MDENDHAVVVIDHYKVPRDHDRAWEFYIPDTSTGTWRWDRRPFPRHCRTLLERQAYAISIARMGD